MDRQVKDEQLKLSPRPVRVIGVGVSGSVELYAMLRYPNTKRFKQTFILTWTRSMQIFGGNPLYQACFSLFVLCYVCDSILQHFQTLFCVVLRESLFFLTVCVLGGLAVRH